MAMAMHIKFENEIQKQTGVMHRKQCPLLSPDTEQSNMATRWPFLKRHCWKSIDFFPYTQVMCQWCLDLISKVKLKLESGNQKKQHDYQAAILKVTSLKMHRLLPIATKNKHMKFEIEIPKQTWVTLRKPCHLQTDRQTDRRTRWIQLPPPTLLGRGYKDQLNLFDRHTLALQNVQIWMWYTKENLLLILIKWKIEGTEEIGLLTPS